MDKNLSMGLQVSRILIAAHGYVLVAMLYPQFVAFEDLREFTYPWTVLCDDVGGHKRLWRLHWSWFYAAMVQSSKKLKVR